MNTLNTSICFWLFFFTFVNSVSADAEAGVEVSTEDDDSADTITIHGTTARAGIHRNARHFIFPFIHSVQVPVPILHHPLIPFFSDNRNVECITQDGSQGICKSFKECYPLLALPNSGTPGYFVRNEQLQYDILNTTSPCFPQTTVHQFVPTFTGSRPIHFTNFRSNNERSADEIICCITKKSKPSPVLPLSGEVGKNKIKQTTKPPEVDDSNGKNWPPVSSSCLRGNVIVNAPGVEANAPANAYPWMAALLNKDNKQFCGGALIDNYNVLTAAHCLQHYNYPHQVGNIKVVLGAHNILDPTEKGRVEIKVAKLIKHAHFSKTTFVHDIALVRLSEPVNFTTTIQPLCLKKKLVEDIVDTRKMLDSGTLAGWGKTNETNPSTSPTLRHAVMKLWTNEDCQRKYDQHPLPDYVPKIEPTMICAGSPGLDACHGDSGGPLFLTKSPGTGYGQIGIVSWGVGCGRFPGVYTRVSSYADWIKKNSRRRFPDSP